MIDVDATPTDATVRLTYPRVYASPDGETHFQDLAVPMAPTVFVPGIPLVDVGEPHPVTALTLSRLEAGYTSAWHPPPPHRPPRSGRTRRLATVWAHRRNPEPVSVRTP